MATLNLQILEQLVHPVIFARGEDYYHDGRVYDLRRDGKRLRATVMGRRELNHTWLQVSPPYASDCSCPYDDTCKHVVAVGLAWLDRETRRAQTTDTSPPADSIYQRVSGLERPELIDLVSELLDTVDAAHGVVRDFLLQRSVADYASRPGAAATEAGFVRDQVRTWFAALDADAGDPVDDLADPDGGPDFDPDPDERDEQALIDIGEQVGTLVHSICSVRPADGVPFAVLALAGVAAEVATATTRFDAGRWDMHLSQIGQALCERLADPNCPAAIAQQAVAEILAAYLGSTSWYGHPLELTLQQVAALFPDMGPHLVSQLRQAATEPALHLAAKIHLAQDSPGAALELLRQAGASDQSLLRMAHLCRQHGDAETAAAAARAAVAAATSLRRTHTQGLAAQFLLEAGHQDEALALLLAVFQAEPTAWRCRQVLDAAPPQQQARLAREMFEALPNEPDLHLALELCLAMGDTSAAADLMDDPRASLDLKARVAAALVPTDLDRAVRLWRAAVELRIRDQNRGAYAAVSQWLTDMRGALVDADRVAQWQRYRSDLAERYPRHRALHQELEIAGL